jgi:hypothetical protein
MSTLQKSFEEIKAIAKEITNQIELYLNKVQKAK